MAGHEYEGNYEDGAESPGARHGDYGEPAHHDGGQENGDRYRERKSREHEKSRERDDRRHRDDRDRRSDRERDYDRDRDRERDRDERHKTRDRERRRSRDRERERRHKHRSRSRSKGRSRDRSKSRSRSRSRDRDRRSRGSKRTSGFDMAPPGAAVVTGATPGQLPGIAQTVPGVFSMFPFAGTQFAGLPAMPAQAMTQQATRHARRVYVGGLPPLANEQTIATFFSQVMSAIGGNTAGPGDAVVNVYINQEKKFAFVEMRTVEEASNAMALDGIIFEGVSVRVRRPSDYNPSMAATLGPSQPSPHLNLTAVGLTPGAAGGADGPDRIFVGGLPYYLTEGQIKELLESFGPLRGFDLVKDRDTGNSKGYGFCVYQDPAVTDVACAALNGLKMGDKTLTVRRATASVHSGQPKPDQANVLAQAQQQIALQKLALQGAPYYNMMMPGVDNGMTMPETPTKVVCLKQVVSPDELKEDDEYEEILEDMREECGKYGGVATLVLPRPKSNGEDVAGVGKVFVEYNTIEEAIKAKNSLNGRKFGGNIVAAVYFPEDKFLQGEYNFEPPSS